MGGISLDISQAVLRGTFSLKSVLGSNRIGYYSAKSAPKCSTTNDKSRIGFVSQQANLPGPWVPIAGALQSF